MSNEVRLAIANLAECISRDLRAGRPVSDGVKDLSLNAREALAKRLMFRRHSRETVAKVIGVPADGRLMDRAVNFYERKRKKAV